MEIKEITNSKDEILRIEMLSDSGIRYDISVKDDSVRIYTNGNFLSITPETANSIIVQGYTS